MNNELIKELKNEFTYNFSTGDLKKKSNGKFVHTQNVVFNSKRYSRKLISWVLFYGEKPEGQIIHKDLNENNFALYNLTCITNEEYRKLNRLIKNARKYIHLRECNKDVYDVYVEWLDFDNGKRRKEKFSDHTVARKFMRSLLRELLRELEQLGVNLIDADIFERLPRL